MPIDVMPSSFRSEQFLADNYLPKSHKDPEAKAGSMILLSPDGRKQGVQVNVYRTSLEHFAVIYPQKKVCKPLGVINLRNTSVERMPGDSHAGFLVRQRGFDNTTSISFICETDSEIESWICAFTSRTSPTIHPTCLPVVEEDEEN